MRERAVDIEHAPVTLTTTFDREHVGDTVCRWAWPYTPLVKGTQDRRLWRALSGAYWAADQPEQREAILARARARLGEVDNAGWNWLYRAVGGRDNESQFAAAVLRSAGQHLEHLFAPMVHAAVYEVDPSFNRRFVEPALHAFGARRVNDALFAYVERGTDFEKAGAMNALYWSEVLLDPRSSHPPTDEQIATYPALADVWRRKQGLLLREFVRNENVEVRRAAIPHLRFDDPDAFPPEDRPFLDEAVRIGRAHSDEYVRHRTGVQLGEARTFPCLPHRTPE